MGKHAQYAKRGSAKQYGFLSAPADADWSAVGTSTTQIQCTKTVPIPPGASDFTSVAQLVTGGALVQGVTTGGNVSNINGLAVNTFYLVRTAWANGTVRVSEFSNAKLVATLP